MTELLTENLPLVRCKPSLKNRLALVAQRSITRDLSDHIRYAVEMYVNNNWSQELEAAFASLDDEEEAHAATN